MGFIKRYKEISLYRKDFDIVTNIIHYPIASFFCAVISPSFITPNMVTLLAVLSELSAIWFIFINLVEYKILIVLLLQLGWIFDLMDGMLARFKRIGFYHSTNPSLKGYYWDAVSDHILRLGVLTFLGIHLVQQDVYGLYYAFGGVMIYAMTQVEHIIRDYILKGVEVHQSSKDKGAKKLDVIIKLFNNIYIFYFIFILSNRIDLLFIVLPTIQAFLLIKRVFQFSSSDY
ncbi:MAG: CDP-alcohol phosphatidyltransferase family protein [Candidatus Marinimicrobia bacterium]|jgi:phosphatidylglycerophosphate synthase|nr:CDP-alcohol phosphatidyltransferase family protein [Candidatus Neomarinimicrobiota bacterium]MBT5759085.1 CDP-alcohol phosphatidyltransferase family protein [Candidatus Neomarinimicrobiota bacterium]MBT6471976.1 CDP-alcohol phosphatidyltransferase family protein [Candidatus Neomarinimicrobiota bacterium]MBT6938286.1 CDP-alcohol phosphatidyltransferase family protein [Candidatus Neomarinimicrobiota bacterium]|tara:strand:+ start:98 stop:787 length:690 start_codon:yes stop_codon:yes gene_type:complete